MKKIFCNKTKLLLSLTITLLTTSFATAQSNLPSFKVPAVEGVRFNGEYGTLGGSIPYRILNGTGSFAYFKSDNTIGILSADLKETHSFSFNLKENESFQGLIDCTAELRYNGAVLATQHLFNNDDLYEIVIATQTEKGEVFYVYNEKGEKLMEIPYFYYFIRNGNFYLYDYGANTLYYIGETSQNDISYLTEDNLNLIVTPNPVTAEEMTLINLPENVEEGSVVSVMSIDGKTIFSKKILDGVKQVTVPGYMLGKGINPVVLTSPVGDIIATGKILGK